MTVNVNDANDPVAGGLTLSTESFTSVGGQPQILDVRVNDSDPDAKTLEFVFDRPVSVELDGAPINSNLGRDDLYVFHHNVGGGGFGDRMSFSGGSMIESDTVLSIDIDPNTYPDYPWPTHHNFWIDHNNSPTGQGLRVVDSSANDYPLGDVPPTG